MKEFDSEKVTKEMIKIAAREVSLEEAEAEQNRETPYLPDQHSLVSTAESDIKLIHCKFEFLICVRQFFIETV